MFLAENATFAGDAQPDEDEFLDTVIMPFEKAFYQAMTGGINDSKTVICLARAENKLKKRKK